MELDEPTKFLTPFTSELWEIEMEHGYDIGVSLRTLDEVKAEAR
jgi:hypothetical protein